MSPVDELGKVRHTSDSTKACRVENNVLVEVLIGKIRVPGIKVREHLEERLVDVIIGVFKVGGSVVWRETYIRHPLFADFKISGGHRGRGLEIVGKLHDRYVVEIEKARGKGYWVANAGCE